MLAFARYAFIGYIPPSNTNVLASSNQKFLSYAGHEEINWHTLESGTFEQARASNKPILLVIGTSASSFGREYDLRAFEDVDTAQFVNLNFFCIRIDGYEHPEWINALLPVSRLRLEVVPSFQVWTLDQDGHVLSFIGRTYKNAQLDTRGLYRNLVDARNQYDRMKARKEAPNSRRDMQAADLEYIATHPGTSWPSLSAFAELLGTRCDRRYGGFPVSDVQGLYPNAWRFLTVTGYTKLWQESLGPLLTSKLVDVQDGGFFRLALTRDIGRVELAKGTRQNAEMMLTLAFQGQLDGDPFYTELAKRTYDWMVTCASRNVLLPACQEDDENPQSRSPRLSFPTWRLHEVFGAPDRDWVSLHLGLDPIKNAQMIPYLKSRGSLLDDPSRFNQIVSLMRTNTGSLGSFNDAGYLDVNGHSVARMLEVVRIWDDERRLDALKPLMSKLHSYGDKTDLIHWAKDESSLLSYLGDYLGLSDALLQEYLTTGRIAALNQGLQYLNLARTIFAGNRPGQLNLSRNPEQMGGFQSLCVPEIVDNIAESCSAQAIRLETAYGRLTADTDGGQELLRAARQTTALFADIASSGGPQTGGYFCAAADVLDGRYAVAVGPNAQSLASELYRLRPTRFVAPLQGQYRKDIQAAGPGIYVIGVEVHGPFTVAQAAKSLPAAFESRNAP